MSAESGSMNAAVLANLQAAAEMPAGELAATLVENNGYVIPPETAPKKRITSLRFPPDVYDALTIAAKERDLSLNFLVVAAVREFLDRLIPADEVRYTR